MTKHPKTCEPETALSHAARLMWENDLGCLPVTEGGDPERLVGVVTDRDICMAAHFAGRPLNEMRVAEAMTMAVWACNAGDDVAEAEAIMREAGVRRLPVIDESERLIGLLSLADLAREALRQRRRMKPDLTVAQVGLVLGRICQPRQSGSPALDPPACSPAPEPGLATPAEATSIGDL